MRFSFGVAEAKPESRLSVPPKEEFQWVTLQNHPLFSSSPASISTPGGEDRLPGNLTAWDGASRLYYWDSVEECLHRISLRLGEPEASSFLASSPSKVLRPDIKLHFVVNKISINRNGSALLLAGTGGLCVMYLYGQTSAKEKGTICRTVSVGSQIYGNNSNGMRLLRVSWHPYSDVHLGVLSTDCVFRIFDLSSDLVQPEQEYYLQPAEPGRSRNASSICPIDFSFGGDHLWDRFSVFVLFGDGSIYILCPLVPFGSAHKWESVLEMYSDVNTFGINSTNPTAVSNSNLAISWLEATFPELAKQDAGSEKLAIVKACPYALLDASLALQGPLSKVFHGTDDETLAVSGAECEGRAVSLLYTVVSKDSVLVTAWSGGQLQIDALADEIQPAWIMGSPSRLRFGVNDQILGLAMICELGSGGLPVLKLDKPLGDTVWLGYPPPLLRLAIVDLALPQKSESGNFIMLFADPLMPERIYSLHDGGVDSVVLHFLPFTSQSTGKDGSLKTPSVHPVLSTCQEGNATPSLIGFVSLSDSFGYSWVVAITSTRECIVLEMETWNLLLPACVDLEKNASTVEEPKDRDTPDIISKELLSGPKIVLVPQAMPSQHSTAADSIEGRSILHQYFKLFHENYVEYAHKVYFELKHHGPQLKRIISDLSTRLLDAQEKVVKVKQKQELLDQRIEKAVRVHNSLEKRLQQLRSLPVAHKRPLSTAERGFKDQLDKFTGVELHALHSSIETLRARLKRHSQSPKSTGRCMHSPKGSTGNQKRQSLRKNLVQDAQISQLQSSIAKLSLLNSENSKKVKLLESEIKNRESRQN